MATGWRRQQTGSPGTPLEVRQATRSLQHRHRPTGAHGGYRQGASSYSGGKWHGTKAWRNKSAAAKRAGWNQTLDPGQRHNLTQADLFIREFADIMNQYKKDMESIGRKKPGTSV